MENNGRSQKVPNSRLGSLQSHGLSLIRSTLIVSMIVCQSVGDYIRLMHF